MKRPSKETASLALKEEREASLNIAWSRFRLDLDKRTYIMGILNRTPDSFSDGGKFLSIEDAVSHAVGMVRDGADIIDIGGESSRPGSLPVSRDEEMERVLPLIKRLKDIIDIPISIDTTKSSVAEAALENGASMVNDITGLKNDKNMAAVCAKYDVPVVVMHIKGASRTMQINPRYNDLIGEITRSLEESIEIAKDAGIDQKKIIIDPGIGFGKTLAHNLEIIRGLSRFRALERPIMVGTSRKSFIGEILNRNVGERLIGSVSAAVVAISNGANIIRAHDIKETKEAAKIADSICRIGQ